MGILDFILRRKPSITQTSGTNGVAAYSGKLVSFEISPDLQGRNLYTTIGNQISNSVVIGAGVRYFQNLIAGTSWTVTPKEDAGADGERAADLVRTGLIEANMPESWDQCVKRQAMFRMLGFAIHEWKMRKRPSDGALVYAALEHRPQSTIEYWDMPNTGGPILGVVQRPLVYGDYYYVDRSRMFYAVDNALSDSPEGMGVLRHVVEHARRLQRYEQLEGMSYETDMRGIPVGRIPYQQLAVFAKDKGLGQNWIDAQVKAIEDLVRNHIKSPWQGITIDSIPYTSDAGTGQSVSTVPQWALELLKGDGTGLTEIAATIERVNREIARVMGMEFMILGGDGKGSLALSRDKTSMFASVLEATLHELAFFTRRDLVWPLLTLNGLDPELCAPDLQPDPIATERIEVAVDALLKLAQAGAILTPDDPAIDQIRGRLHLADQPKLPPELISQRLGLTPPGSEQPPKGNDSSDEPDDTKPSNDHSDDDEAKTKKGSFYHRSRMRGRVDKSVPPGNYYLSFLGEGNASDGWYANLGPAATRKAAAIGGPYTTEELAVARCHQHHEFGE